MDINSIKSNLEMNNFYFSNYSFTREKCISNGRYNINVEKYIKKIDIHEYHVILQTSIKKSDISLNVIAEADFIFNSPTILDEEKIIKQNAVAIMFPFVRSQITLMTSQPGMTPIVLPTINTAKL